MRILIALAVAAVAAIGASSCGPSDAKEAALETVVQHAAADVVQHPAEALTQYGPDSVVTAQVSCSSRDGDRDCFCPDPVGCWRSESECGCLDKKTQPKKIEEFAPGTGAKSVDVE